MDGLEFHQQTGVGNMRLGNDGICTDRRTNNTMCRSFIHRLDNGINQIGGEKVSIE